MDLSLHEGGQRRDNQCDAGEMEGGELIVEGFAAARRHDDEGVATRQAVTQGVTLAGAKDREAEVVMERGEERAGYGQALLETTDVRAGGQSVAGGIATTSSRWLHVD